MKSIHRVINTDKCRWAVALWVDWWSLWSCVSYLIVLRIVFLRAYFTSSTRSENQTFHLDKSWSRLYSRALWKSFGLELTTFPGLFKQNYTTLHYTTLYSYMTSHKKTGRCHWKCIKALKISEGDVADVSSHNLRNHNKYFV